MLNCTPPYQILALSSGVRLPLLLHISCLWRHIDVCKTTFWRSLLIQHAYYSTRILLTRCFNVCLGNERISTWSYENGAKHSTQRYDRVVQNCKSILQRFKTGEIEHTQCYVSSVHTVTQARRQFLRFGEAKSILVGQVFCFYYMF